jgi:YidC/Oxa1 family membrane protein insertase
VLSALVLLGWSLLSDRLLPTAGPQTQRVENGKVKPVPQPQADPAADRRAAMAKAVPTGADQVARLEGALHRSCLS